MCEGGEIGDFIVREALAPALEHDALPLEGESAHGAGVTLAFGDLGLEEEFGPGAMESRLTGILEEALMEEVWAAVTAMNPMLILATLFGDRSDAAVLLDGGRIRITGALASKGASEPGCQSEAGAGEALPDGGIVMAGEELLNLRVILLDGKAQLE